MIKRIVQTLLFVFICHCAFGQSIGLTFQYGGEYRANTDFTLRNSFNNSRYLITSLPGLVFKNYLGVNFYEKDGTGFDLALSYDNFTKSINDLSRLDSTGFGSQSIGERAFQSFDVYADRYYPLAKRNERLKLMWGIGLNGYYQKAEIKNVQVSNLFNSESTYTGIIPRLLGKLTYQTKRKRFLLESTFGLNVLDISYAYSKTFDPMLTGLQQTNSILDFDFPRAAYWRFGVVYLFLKKDKSEKTTEKTQNE